jgi:type II secretion system protein H
MRRRSAKSGFTLFELVMVLLVIAVVVALAQPSFTNWSRASRLRNTGYEFLALTQYARTQAVANGRIYRIMINKVNGLNYFWVEAQDGTQFAALPAPEGRLHRIPDDFSAATSQEDSRNNHGFCFYPTGRCDPATVQFTSGDGHTIQISCETPTDVFRIVQHTQ